jgi:antitoxin component YwqK of YwqJK toxin-antitoxin module
MNKFNENGKKHGQWEEYSVNGTLFYRENYINGKLNGLCEGYYSNGKLDYKVNFVNGKLHGLLERYYYNGKLTLKVYYILINFQKKCNISNNFIIFAFNIKK